jgi:hypothetical protein
MEKLGGRHVDVWATSFFVLSGRKHACGKSLNVRYYIRRRIWALTTSCQLC